MVVGWDGLGGGGRGIGGGRGWDGVGGGGMVVGWDGLGGGWEGDRWWAGLQHYTPGLKMDPTPALLLLHHDCTYFCHFYVYRVYLFKF